MRAEIVLIYFLSLLFAVSLSAQAAAGDFTLVAFGTGQTTGHIATLTVTNNTGEEVVVAAQSFLLPSLQTYQSYVGRIPAGISIGAGASTEIAITGFCIDVHRPPVPLGRALLPVEDWVPVEAKNGRSGSGSATSILPATPLPAFRAADIGFLEKLTGFNVQRANKKAAVKMTYPGSSTPIGGTLDKTVEMAKIAPLLVAMVQRIEAITPIIQEDYPTPFQEDLRKEREAIIQQTVWIFMAHLMGTTYTKEDFAHRVAQEFEQRTGTLASSLPPAQQAKLTTGTDNFWTAFLATGTAAQVWQ